MNLTEELNKKLQQGYVDFAYRKKDGSLRIATGTTKIESIPEEDHPTGTGAEKTGVKSYYDSNVQGWRSFNPLCVVWVSGVGFDALNEDEQTSIFNYMMNK